MKKNSEVNKETILEMFALSEDQLIDKALLLAAHSEEYRKLKEWYGHAVKDLTKEEVRCLIEKKKVRYFWNDAFRLADKITERMMKLI